MPNTQKNAKKPSTISEGSSTSPSVNVWNPYTLSSRRGRAKTVKVQFRLSGEVYGVVRRNVVNVSAFLRGLVFEALNRLPVAFSTSKSKTTKNSMLKTKLAGVVGKTWIIKLVFKIILNQSQDASVKTQRHKSVNNVRIRRAKEMVFNAFEKVG